jgi:hypothetical protein
MSLSDIPTKEEVRFLINSVRKVRFRIFLLVVYSLGLRTTEGGGASRPLNGYEMSMHADGKAMQSLTLILLKSIYKLKIN